MVRVDPAGVRGVEFLRARAQKYRARRRRARFVYYYPASGLLALAGVALVFGAGFWLPALLVVPAIVLWRLGEVSYRCPSCRRIPDDTEGLEFSPTRCVHCGATLKWRE